MTMKYKYALIIAKGDAKNLVIVEDDIPEPAAGQVRVKMQAAGVSAADILMREGIYPVDPPSFPFIPGYDIVGIVDKCGEGATKFQPGQQVAALTKTGAYAEYICIPEDDLVLLPSGVDPVEAVATILNYLTAYQILHRVAQVKQGEKVLIYAAGGGIGTSLIDLGKLVDLEMYGTDAKSKQQVLVDMGVTPIDYQSEDVREKIMSLTGDGVDLALDPIGGENCFRAYSTLREGGKVVSFGVSFGLQGETPTLRDVYIWFNAALSLNLINPTKKVMTYAVSLFKQENHDLYIQDLTAILNLLAEKKIKPVIDRTMPLSEARKAHQLLDNRAVKGKIVLVP
ncbi:medium chain dehydrogenase/reductase family protein [[Phormidium] sp. ETS-05]|uniref:medium chain dehydrogenase/reductase family protein n=1 Tax=[Phormidium] sp. ETS-05 TaxID=222819 RepID=UPI0018EEDE0B|nr:medium chain dehydrogenase/reductase family protein [[Phormidium] sp. ETS-05]